MTRINLVTIVGLACLVASSSCKSETEETGPKLGMSREEVETMVGGPIELSGTLLDYSPGQPTSEQLDRDIKYYLIQRQSDTIEVNFGFNARERLIQIVKVETRELYPPPGARRE